MTDEKKEKVERCIKLATDYYLKALQLDNTNIFAANGIGMMMAEKGYTDQAKDIFIQVTNPFVRHRLSVETYSLSD